MAVPRVYDCKDSTRALMKRRRYFSSDSDDESQGDESEERAVAMGSNTAAGHTQTEPRQQRRSVWEVISVKII